MYSLLTKAVINHAEVIIQYQAWLSSIDELHECEDLLDGEDIIEDDPDDEDGSYLVEIQATLTADNQHSFSLFELLYKIHNLLQNKDLDNLNTLDSISLAEKGEVPIYYLNFK
ncbi:hypothetical protein GJV76_12825 [Myroides sp. BIT-d1]|uniref:Uncharacterized protein n=2 Tax=Myroides albus TaxID=2562892 RepID=A0A6I3LKZ0_9FLAO|nr:hypothetical protein [Myroides albus]MTG99003.1 hypothetical protein [Myroides albus]